MTRMLRILCVLGLLWLVLLPRATDAADANLRLSVPETLHHIDDLIPVTVKLDSQGAVVNAVNGDLVFSTLGLEVVKIEQAFQNFPLWPDQPTWNNSTGRIRFTAGRPNGLIASGATIATIYVRAMESGLWQVAVGPTTRMYRNDGQGTAVPLFGNRLDLSVVDPLVPRIAITVPTHPDESAWYREADVTIRWDLEPNNQYSYSFASDPLTSPDDVPDETAGVLEKKNLTDGVYWFAVKTRGGSGIWERTTRRAIRIDLTAPRPLDLRLLPADEVDGRMVVAWTAYDESSGIRDQRLMLGDRFEATVDSPLEIKNAWHGQTITVVVRDQAGNIAKMSLRIPGARPIVWQSSVLAVSMLVLLGVLVWWLHRRKKRGGMIY